MATLRALLELYGAFDHALIDDDNPELASTIDRLFPGSSANLGWYRELEEFFFAGATSGPKTQADPLAALNTIIGAHQEHDSPNLVQQSQILYGLLALNQVQREAPTVTLPDLAAVRGAFGSAIELFTAQPEEQLTGSAATRESTAPGDAVARRADDDQAPDEEPEGSPQARTAVDDVLDEVATMFDNRSAWREVVAFVADELRLDQKIVDVPLCEAYLANVDGTPCVVVDTEFASDAVTFNQVLSAVNPFNWNRNYPDFFCGMSGSGPHRSDGWGRVLEHVSFCGWDGVRGLSTALRYYPKQLNATYACLDYDLDDPTPGPGDGQVTVDCGYINVASTSGSATTNGVRINTRKVVHINGILPYAQARLVCITGYGSASMQFICGAAEIEPPRPHKFDYLGPGTASNTSPPAKPAHPVPTAVKVWTKMLQDVTTSYVDLAEKWTTSGLTIKDVADYSTQVGGRLASTPWEVLQAVVKPPPPPATTPTQGQGGGA